MISMRPFLLGPLAAMARIMAAVLIAAFLPGCLEEDSRVAGGGGVEVEGITVEGMALYPDSKPVAGARVRVRPWDYLKPAPVPKLAINSADTVTDSLGRFTVDSLDVGVYTIEVDAGESGTALLKVEADGSRKRVQVEGTVWAGGILSGHVLAANGLGLGGVTVGVYGLDRSARTDDGGAFQLLGVPPGVYTLKIQSPSDSFSSIDLPEVAVGAGSRVTLDSLVLPPAVAGLKGHWRFDEGLGKVAADAVGTEARAILYNALWTPGKLGTAVDLRDRGYASVPRSKAASIQISEGGDFMVAAWFKADPTAGSGRIRTLADTRTSYLPIGYMVGMESDGKALFVASVAGNPEEPKGATLDSRLAGGPRLDDGNWHHLAAGRSGGRFILYADGLLVSESPAPNGALTLESPLFIGGKEGLSDFFTGLVDDLRLYDRGLTDAEAGALAGISGH